MITKELVKDIQRRVSCGLTKGLGKPQDGGMCIEAVICAAYGLPHSDNPPCVGNEIRRAKIALNDCNWSSDKARADGMLKLGVAQLGSDKLDQEAFSKQLFWRSCQLMLPLIIAVQIADKAEADEVASLTMWQEKFRSCSLDSCITLWKKFCNYGNNYHYDYYYNNYNNNNNNYRYYSYYSHYYNKDNKFLLVIAETILQSLKDLDCEGCKWLWVLDEKE